MKLGPNQQAWMAALRSGEYHQGTGQLQACSEYCCLGVLCEVAELAGVPVIRNDAGEVFGDDLGYQTDVRRWSALRTNMGRWALTAAITEDFKYPAATRSLAALNDQEHWPFKRIADFIEKYAEQLFQQSA